METTKSLVGRRAPSRVAVLAISLLLAVLCCLAVNAQSAQATAWNNNVTVTATANDFDPAAQSTDYNQTISVTLNFSNALPESVTTTDIQSYMQDNITIAGRTIKSGDADNYYRIVTVADDAISADRKSVNFTIGLNNIASINYFTANYNSQLLIANNSDYNTDISTAMGNADVETLINTGLGVELTNVDSNTATLTITQVPQCRSMNFVLIQLSNGTDANGNELTPTNIFTAGTSAGGAGLTIHSHEFYDMSASDYANELVTAANEAGAADLGYTFTASGNTVTITKSGGLGDHGLVANVYNGNYLNSHGYAVGQTTEDELPMS